MEASELAPADALDATELAPSEAVDATDDAPDAPDPATPPIPKMVVEPTVVVPTADPSEEMVDSMAEVVMAEDEPVADPDSLPPAAPTPKIVVDPTVVVPMVDPSETMVDSIAEVVIAEEVPVMVVETAVTRVVEVAPAERKLVKHGERERIDCLPDPVVLAELDAADEPALAEAETAARRVSLRSIP